MTIQFDVLFNSVGIILEIIGFAIFLRAVRPIPTGLREVDRFGPGWRNAPNLMSTLHLKANRFSIGLVIAGLCFQLISGVFK